MKIIVSPSKTLEIRTLKTYTDNTYRLYKKDRERLVEQEVKTHELVRIIKGHKSDVIKKKMKLTDNLLEQVLQYYEGFENNKAGQALLCYTGTVFKELKFDSYSHDSFRYANKHVVILSALYGPIPAFYKIKLYRLDMTMSLFEESLYSFWKETCNGWFDSEKVIIDLASKEFSKLIQGHKLTFDFLQPTDKGLKTIAYHSKQARGFMLNYLISKKIENIEEIKDFDIDGYKFSKDFSESMHYVFVREK